MLIRSWPFFNFSLAKPKTDTKIFFAVGLLLVAALMIFITLWAVRNKSIPIPPEQKITETQAAVIKPDINKMPVKGGELKDTPVEVKRETKSELPVAEDISPIAEQPLLPLEGEKVKLYGWSENEIYKDWRLHSGIDIKAPENTPVRAALSGKVISVSKNEKTGLTVAIESGQFTYIYGSLNSTHLTPGEDIKRGNPIGYVGSFEAEPFFHLHLSIIKNKEYINPTDIFN